jgi:hypothetical protein
MMVLYQLWQAIHTPNDSCVKRQDTGNGMLVGVPMRVSSARRNGKELFQYYLHI